MNLLNNKIYENLDLLPLDLQGWNGDKPIFRELINEVKPTTIVEIGTWKGQSAINMGKICKELGLQTKIYCIDTWLGSLEFWHGLNDTKERDLMLKNGYPMVYFQFLSNVVHSGLQDVIIPVPLPSSIGVNLLNKLNIKSELIYIDGSHDYISVRSDIVSVYKLSSDNTVLFGDDYETFPDVSEAVNDVKALYEQPLHLRTYNLQTKDNFWILRNKE